MLYFLMEKSAGLFSEVGNVPTSFDKDTLLSFCRKEVAWSDNGGRPEQV